jgi:hypothetical protein
LAWNKNKAAGIQEKKRTDGRGIAMLNRGMHGGIVFVDKNYNALLVNIPKIL